MGFEVFKNVQRERNFDSKKYSVSVHSKSRLYFNKGITDFFCERGVVHISVLLDEKRKKIALEGHQRDSPIRGYTLSVADSNNRSSIFVGSIIRKCNIGPLKNVEAKLDEDNGRFQFSYE